MKAVLELIKQMYPTRTCKYLLSEETLKKGSLNCVPSTTLGIAKAV